MKMENKMELTKEIFQRISKFNRVYATATVIKVILQMLDNPKLDMDEIKTFLNLYLNYTGTMSNEELASYGEFFKEFVTEKP